MKTDDQDRKLRLVRRNDRLQSWSLAWSDVFPPETLSAWHERLAGLLELRTVVCSRLGHAPQRHRFVCQQLTATLRDMSDQRSALLVGETTAIEPWALHAAETYGVSVLRLTTSESNTPKQPADEFPIRPHLGQEMDLLTIALADRIDAAYVRRGGKIQRLLERRLAQKDSIVRIGIDSSCHNLKLTNALLDAGAIGRFVAARQFETLSAEQTHRVVDWSYLDSDEWLIHCTRAHPGPWPGQTMRQYRDDVLLGTEGVVSRERIDALARVLKMQRLIAGAVTSRHHHDVVCFSAIGLRELLAKRTYRSHLHRWDYEPVGLAIRKSAAVEQGLQPVIYGTDNDYDRLPTEQRYRFAAIGNTHDWRDEQEWRHHGDLDLSRLASDDLCVFVPSADEAAKIPRHPSWGEWPVLLID